MSADVYQPGDSIWVLVWRGRKLERRQRGWFIRYIEPGSVTSADPIRCEISLDGCGGCGIDHDHRAPVRDICPLNLLEVLAEI